MINIGINYIVERNESGIVNNLYDNIYDIFIKHNYISILKYPGRYCNLDELSYCINLVNKNNISIDIHGLPGMVAATHDSHFCSNITWDKIPSKLWKLNHNSRISTHIGLVNHDRLQNHSLQDLNNTFYSNMEKMKNNLLFHSGLSFEIGGELQPGGFDFDKQTLTPEFIGNVWNEMNFGVFDITHAKLICKDLNILFTDYLKSLPNKDKVKIIHIAGNTDITNSYLSKPDKHVLTTIEEFYELNSILKYFTNVDSVISEYAYPTQFYTQKEICMEIINLYFAITNVLKLDSVFNLTSTKLENDASNLENLLLILEKYK